MFAANSSSLTHPPANRQDRTPGRTRRHQSGWLAINARDRRDQPVPLKRGARIYLVQLNMIMPKNAMISREVGGRKLAGKSEPDLSRG